MDTSKLAIALTSLSSGIVLMLSIFKIIPADQIDSLNMALNQLTGGISTLILIFTPSPVAAFRAPDSRTGDVTVVPILVSMCLTAALLSSVIALPGCSTVSGIVGGLGTQSIRNQISSGYAIASDYLDRTDRLFSAGAITKEEAQSRLDAVKRASNGLSLARVALTECTTDGVPEALCTPAQQYTVAAQAILRELEIYIVKREGVTK